MKKDRFSITIVQLIYFAIEQLKIEHLTIRYLAIRYQTHAAFCYMHRLFKILTYLLKSNL